MSGIKKITVFGATGMLAKPVVRELVNAGFEVTAMVRQLEKARQELPAEVEIVSGDLQNRANIERALENAEGVYMNLSVKPETKEKDFQPERDGLRTILEAAKSAGVKRIALLSSLVHRYQEMNGFHWWSFDIKKQAVAMIKTSGIPYTIFFPSNFMENLDKGGYMRGNKIMLAGKQKFPMWWIAGSDYGRQVAKAFHLNSAANREFAVQGLESFLAEEAAKVFAENYQKGKLTISKTPMFALKLAGLFSRQMHNTAKIIEALNNYPEKFESEQTWTELGKPTVRLAEYARNC